MNKFSSVATYLVRKLWTVVAISLVVFALLMSLLRYSLPLLNDKKHLFEEFAQTEYGVALQIESISASWQGIGPAIVLNEVSLEQSEKSPISLNIQNIYIEIDFWDSLLTGQISSKNFSLDGLLLDLDLQRIQGDSDTDFPIMDALEGLFLEQLQTFSLVNSVVSVSGENNRQSFNIQNLSWLNKGERHQGSGLMKVSELANNSAVFVIDLVGNANNFDGTIYAKADELDLSPWVNEFSALESELLEGRANFEFWADINRRKLTKVYGKIKPTRFIWKQEPVDLSSGIDSGIFVAQPKDGNWLFNIKELKLSVYDQVLSTDWKGSLSKSGELQIQSDSAFPIEPLLPLTGLFSNELNRQLRDIELSATLDKLSLQKRPNGISAWAEIKQLGWQQNENLPGVSDLAVTLAWQKNVGAVTIEGTEVNVDVGEMFDNDFVIDKMLLPLQFYQNDDIWHLSAKQFQIELPETALGGAFDYNFGNDVLNSVTKVKGLDVSNIKRFLPNEPLLGKEVKSFLSRAFYAEGKVEEAQILWNGRFADYPFTNNDGVFQAQVDIRDADFLFDKTWPSITSLDLDLQFENLGLAMKSKEAKLGEIDIRNINAYIPLLTKGADLIIEAVGVGNGYGISQVFAQSNLKDSLGRTLSQDVLVSNEIEAQLSIYVPLDDTKSTSASGIVTLNDNFVQIPSLQLELEKTAGRLIFDNDKIWINKLKAELLGQTIAVDFKGEQADDDYVLDIDVIGENWDVSPLMPYISEDLGEYLSGKTSWQSSIDVALGKSDYEYTATVFSQLDSINSLLPAPFDKQKGATKALSADINGNKQASNIKVTLGNEVTFDGILPHKEMQFSRAHLAIGATDFVGRGVGFSISANLPEIQLTTWYQSIAAILSGVSADDNVDGAKKPLFEAPQRIFIETENLIVAGQSLSDVDATVKTLNKDWIIDLVSDQAKAQITFHQRWLEEGIEINADFVRFNEWLAQEQDLGPEIEPQSLPRIRLKCADCEVFGNNLGAISFESFPNDDGLRFESFNLDGPNGKIRASGQWYKRNGDHYTFINGDMNSSDFGAFLKDFQFDSGIKDSEARMNFTATWKSSPFDFSFEYLDGEIDWQLSDGYITELSDKGSRIFTLLSLDSLVRKLSLDFRDVFAKGFFYDEMQGTVQITEGKADTRDTRIDGGAGEMEIYGYTDLVSKELNYNVSFTPNVTGNLPVLVYFMVNPPTALAALALDQMLTSAKVISNVNYSVTGTIAEPIMIETGRESTEVELPARRDALPEEVNEFIPPSPEDTLMMEVNDG